MKLWALAIIWLNILGLSQAEAEEQCPASIEKQDCEADKRGSVWTDNAGSACMRVATLELYRERGRDCRSTADLNLETIDRAARVAAGEGAELLLTPEDGITYGTREDLTNCLEEIPDPESVVEPGLRNPCDSSEEYKNVMPILWRLSCIAKSSRIFLIANYGTRESCQPGVRVGEEICPERGFFMLNTNVVLNSEGNLIKRYRKYHPFTRTELFDKAPSLEVVHFNVGSMKVGLFTCFDLLFARPGLDLVEREKVDVILFPTWWFDELPVLTATQIQDGWSLANGVSMISANILSPSIGSTGSAIFSGEHMVHTSVTNKRTKLLLANVAKRAHWSNAAAACANLGGGFKPSLIDVGLLDHTEAYASSEFKLVPSDSVDYLVGDAGQLEACSGLVCCTVGYKLLLRDKALAPGGQRLALVVRDSPRAGFFGWHEQACFVATVERAATELVYARSAHFRFEQLHVRLSTSSEQAYPFGSQAVSSLIARTKRHFECQRAELQWRRCEHSLKQASDVLAFGIYARLYQADVAPEQRPTPVAHSQLVERP